VKYKNLTVIGTSHIARHSLREVRELIKKEKPDILALELDKSRYRALLEKRQNIRPHHIGSLWKLGITGFLFALLGSFVQKKLGKYVGVMPGSEMLTAIKLAKKHKIHTVLIDQPIEITLRKLSGSISWREKRNFLVDILKGIFFPKQALAELGNIDLTRVPEKELIRKLLRKIKERYPNLHHVLITERNRVMSTNLANLMAGNPGKSILAVVGAGHEDEIMRLIRKLYSIRKQQSKTHKQPDTGLITYSYSVNATG